MSSDLKAVRGITNIETNLDEQTCSFEIAAGVDVGELINGLMQKNNKLSAWTFLD
ncbi:MAG: hypothetical protein P8J91_15610 [Pirellulaceae bacterium]|nr:hypothetical protein [Pirellulaceae bacterium]MDG1809914.1 hypothetical protein [Pirellulaceae bacterium]MDG2105177.1 hypothetical protein [Pirellulaceae bacterium]